MAKSEIEFSYEERVLPGLWFYAATLVIPLSLFLIALPFGEMLALFLIPGSIIPIWVASWLNSPKIVLDELQLRVGKAVIERKYLGLAEAVSSADTFSARNSNLSPLAYSRFQPGVKGLAKVKIQDDRDPTPYWIFSSRNPEILAAQLNRK